MRFIVAIPVTVLDIFPDTCGARVLFATAAGIVFVFLLAERLWRRPSVLRPPKTFCIVRV